MAKITTKDYGRWSISKSGSGDFWMVKQIIKPMSYLILTECPDESLTEKWKDFLANAELPTHYVTPNFFVDPYIRGGQRFAVLSFDKTGKVSAVLTGTDDGKRINSGFAVRPQTCFRRDCDLSEAAQNLLKGLREKGGNALEYINFYTWKPIREFENLGFQTEVSSGTNLIIMLDLSHGAEEIFKAFSQTRRNEIRKAIKQNLVQIKELETESELAELYQIHVDWNRRKGNQPDTFDEMKLAFEQKDHRKIFIAKHEEKVIAGSYYRFCKGGIVEYAANNSLVEFQKLRPNDLIGWHSIQWACREGFPYYSMGGSHLFLRRFGGGEWTTHRYKCDQSFLRIHNLRENIQNITVKTYQKLPGSLKKKVKQIAGKS